MVHLERMTKLIYIFKDWELIHQFESKRAQTKFNEKYKN